MRSSASFPKTQKRSSCRRQTAGDMSSTATSSAGHRWNISFRPEQGRNSASNNSERFRIAPRRLQRIIAGNWLSRFRAAGAINPAGMPGHPMKPAKRRNIQAPLLPYRLLEIHINVKPPSGAGSGRGFDFGGIFCMTRCFRKTEPPAEADGKTDQMRFTFPAA
jgi:hypothetical protein